ncbi:hypothetical protein B0H11DRAFT_2199381 [Mycena galericulata]|nr:hypothetical protein B0H11DRAFT_2199381 [Mycena galericulata]
MPAAPPVHQFIQCPKPGCPERIPSLLVCGKNVPYHEGLEYQACCCGYFKWLAPELVAAAERRWRDSPANGAPPYPPPDGPNDLYSLSPHIPFWNGVPIDPALVSTPPAPPSSQPRVPLVPPSQPVPANSQSGKATCAVRTCKRLAGAKSCTYKMCKQCCENQGKGCRYSGHRLLDAPIASSSIPESGDPSALSRPRPMFSYQSSSSTIDAGDEPLPPKLYKKAMDPDWARKYNANRAEQEKRKIAEEQRRRQDQLFERQVRFCYWSKDGVEPEMFRQQGLASLRLNMADYPALLKKMGLVTTDEVGIFDFDGRCWDREDVDHVMEVVPQQVILVRCYGVVDCPCLDEYINKYGRKPIAPRRALPTTAPKRRRLSSEEPLRPSKSARSFSPSSPASRTSSPIPGSSSSLLFSPPSSPSPSSPSPLTPPSMPVDPDLLWQEGRVLAPLGCGVWPEGMYTRDMATAFRLIGSRNVAERFVEVFGLSFPKGAWYQQQRAWKYSSQAERDVASQLPRTRDGLWTEWRGKSTGWARVAEDKRR